MKRQSVSKMDDRELLREYSTFERWVGDDFSIHHIKDRDFRRAIMVEKEILKRMAG